MEFKREGNLGHHTVKQHRNLQLTTGPGAKALRLPVTLQEGSAGPVADPTGFVQSVSRP